MRVYRVVTPVVLYLLFVSAAAEAMQDWEVGHLLQRTGYGVTPEEYRRFKPMSFEKAVDTLLAETRTQAVAPPPDGLDEGRPDPGEMRGLSDEARRARQMELRRVQTRHGQELKGWWYGEMLATASPLTERMTLFWHNHFTSSLQKVNNPQLMSQQNALLRQHAVGNFKKLLHAIARDPAMIIYLDNANNRKGQPNENFARELLELFTLGEGHYIEGDIKEAARAFTGWHVNRLQGSYFFAARQHDEGIKTFLGQAGNLDGDDVIEAIARQPGMAKFITDKLWREFISPTPDPVEVERLAQIFRDNDLEIKPLLREMLLSPAFRADNNRGTLIKSPVDLMVGTLRTFGLRPDDPLVLVRYGRQLGQDLLAPPNVKGWPGGEAWIDSNTLLLRRQMLQALTRGPDPDRREMARSRRGAAPQGRGARVGGQAAGQTPPTAAQRAAQRRAAELRRQGMQRPQILAQLQKEGLNPSDLRGAVANRRQTADNPDPTASPMADGPGARGMTMPRLDPARWSRELGDNPATIRVLGNLMLPMPPIDTAAGTVSLHGQISAWLLDPVYQLK